MDNMYIVFELVILSFVVYLVGWPLVKSSQKQHTSKETPDTQKDGVLDTLNEIEFDYSMGKLNATDYQELKARYENMAFKLLAEEEKQLRLDEDIDAEILAELERLQATKGGLEQHA